MIKLYMPRVSEKVPGVNGWQAMDRLIEVSHWVEAQFGQPDYMTNYSLDFADNTEDWACFTFYNDTLAFWTQNRWQEYVLTESQWLATPGVLWWGW